MFKGRNEYSWHTLLEKAVIDHGSGCLNWTGFVQSSGYGTVSVWGKHQLVHRMAWTLEHDKPVPPGMCICHACGNRRCINPNHLFVGSAKDNYDDMISKGRGKMFGENFSGTRTNRKRKLSDDDVRAIRASTDKAAWLAQQYGVGITHISLVKNNHRKKLIGASTE